MGTGIREREWDLGNGIWGRGFGNGDGDAQS